MPVYSSFYQVSVLNATVLKVLVFSSEGINGKIAGYRLLEYVCNA